MRCSNDDFHIGETHPNRVRATTGGPLELSGEAVSAADAVNALRAKISGRLEHGAVLIDHANDVSRSPIVVLPLADNPLFDAWLVAVDAYRNQPQSR